MDLSDSAEDTPMEIDNSATYSGGVVSLNSTTNVTSPVSPSVAIATLPPVNQTNTGMLLPLLTAEPIQHIEIETYAAKLEGLYQGHQARPREFLIWLQCQADWTLLEEKLGIKEIERLIKKYRKKYKV
jgi:hypothetical protein